MRSITFSSSRPGADRQHYLTEEDVRMLLSRLPERLWKRLRGVHFTDRSRGVRLLGYVTPGHRDITICALPPRVSLARALLWVEKGRHGGRSPHEFGALRGRQWPRLAVRRFLLYEVFLHELGHLQVVDESAKDRRRRFAREKLAQEFADSWRHRLWSQTFDHPDPVHNRPSLDELAALKALACLGVKE